MYWEARDPTPPPPPQCTKSVYKVKVKVTVSYLTSVAKQAKTASYMGRRNVPWVYLTRETARQTCPCTAAQKIERFWDFCFTTFSRKKSYGLHAMAVYFDWEKTLKYLGKPPRPSCGFFFVSLHHQASRNSSVGRALDWRSKGPWFNPGFRQFFFLFFPFMFSSFYGTKARDTNFTHPVPCFGSKWPLFGHYFIVHFQFCAFLPEFSLLPVRVS